MFLSQIIGKPQKKIRQLFFILVVVGIIVTLPNLWPMLSTTLLWGMFALFHDYRVRSSENSQAIDSVQDAQDAFAFIRKNANKFGIDRNRIAASGGSAGGHLAASLGTLKDENIKNYPSPML